MQSLSWLLFAFIPEQVPWRMIQLRIDIYALFSREQRRLDFIRAALTARPVYVKFEIRSIRPPFEYSQFYIKGAVPPEISISTI